MDAEFDCADYGPKNPVVFCHGLLGFDTVTVGPSIAPVQVAHWRGIRDALEANGIEVCVVVSAVFEYEISRDVRSSSRVCPPQARQ